MTDEAYDYDFLREKGLFRDPVSTSEPYDGDKTVEYVQDTDNKFFYTEDFDRDEIADIFRGLREKRDFDYYWFWEEGRVCCLRTRGENPQFIYNLDHDLGSEWVKGKEQKLEEFDRNNKNVLFDVKEVIDHFYKRLWDHRIALAKSMPVEIDDHARIMAAQRTIDRLMFTYFLAENGVLMGVDRGGKTGALRPSGLFERLLDDSDDFKTTLDDLFFEYISKQSKNDLKPAEAKEYSIRVPYLNGGLFRERDIETSGETFSEREVGVSGFDWENLIDDLNDYNWIITPDPEQDDAESIGNLTPEVLGHVYEKFVITISRIDEISIDELRTTTKGDLKQGNKKVGAYYTPEEITSYIAERTTFEYLKDELDLDEFDTFDAFYDEMADNQAVLSEVAETLSDISILDPAVGSGHFLMSAAEIVFEWRKKCESESDEYNLKREIVTENLYGVDILEGAGEICKLRLWLWLISARKDGMDGEPLPNIDFNIRQGDSLIGFNRAEARVDDQRLLIAERLKMELDNYREQLDDYRGSRGQASGLRDDLISTHDTMQEQLDDWFANVPEIPIEENVEGPGEIERLIEAANGENVTLKLRFASPMSDELKESLEDIGFRTWKKAANLQLSNSDIRADKPEEIFDTIPREDLTRSFVQRELLAEDFADLEPFHWVMEFPNVFSGEDGGGFDVVIENPPYVRAGTMETLKRDIYKDIYETAVEGCDLYVPFIERSFDLLGETGKVGLITSNQFTVTDYGRSLRKHLPTRFGIHEVVDFTGYSAFEGVIIYSMIMIGGTESNDEIDCISVRSSDAVEKVKSDGAGEATDANISRFNLPADTLNEEEWLFLSEKERSARSKIDEKSSQRLDDGDLCTVGSPLKTGQNTTLQADIVEEKAGMYDIKNAKIEATVEDEIWRRTITSDQIERWDLSVPDEITFFPYAATNGEYDLIDENSLESKYPETYKALHDHKDGLLSRKDSRKTWRQLGRPWYSLARVGTPEYFEDTHIVTDIVVKEPHFCIDSNAFLFSTGYVHGITPHEIDIYYLTGLLNTRVMYSYLKPICPPKNSGYMKMEVDQLSKAPVYVPNIVEDLCREIGDVLEEHEGRFDELKATIETEGIESAVGSTESVETVAANMIRETSRKMVEEYGSLSEGEVNSLEQLNEYLAGIVFDLTEDELRALSRI